MTISFKEYFMNIEEGKGNESLHGSKRRKNDEFYTRYQDVAKELQHYWHHFQGKNIYLNCDDPEESAFFQYFAKNKQQMGYKTLLCTCYKNSSFHTYTDLSSPTGKYGYVNKWNDYEIGDLKGDGSYESSECIEFLKAVDVVVTNPPFTQITKFILTLIQYGKKFLIVGDSNHAAYRDIFPLIKNNKMWLGVNAITEFNQPGNTKETKKIGTGVWFTNMEHGKRKEPLFLQKKYNPEEYQKYDNYDAINVNKVLDIPYDYDGVMGVPISFLTKYNPNQFEIVGLAAGNTRGLAGIPTSTGKDGPYINGKLKYNRILIRKK